MSQRGGAVESHLRISDQEIYSDLIPRGKADMILSIEPMEALRYLPFLSPNGTIVTATEAFKNIPNYPDEEQLKEELGKSGTCIFVDAGAIAREVGNQKTYNIVMLGAASPYLGIAKDQLEWAISELFGSKGQDIVNMNILAFNRGIEVKNA